MFNKDDIFSGVLGGIMIGLGCIGYVSCDNRVAGAFIFSLGLLVILSFGWKLFTGSICKNLVWKYKGRSFVKPILFRLLQTYICNFIGILMMAGIYAVKSWGNLEAIKVVAARKIEMGHLSRIFGGVLCEFCIFIAVYGFSQVKNDIRRCLIVIMSIMAFVLSGGEHCIADMFYLAFSGKVFASIIFVIEVTIGNIIGAAVFKWLERGSK